MKHNMMRYGLLLFAAAAFVLAIYSIPDQDRPSLSKTTQAWENRPDPDSFFQTTDAGPESKPAFQSETHFLDNQGRPLYKPGELLVKYKDGVSEKHIEALHKSLGSTVISRQVRYKMDQVKIRTGMSEMDAVRLYGVSPIVEIVERHALRYPQEIPNDPLFGAQWALRNISASRAWDFTRGNKDIVIAVIDTGVDYDHPDLAENIWTNQAEANGVPGIDDDLNGYVDDIRGWDFADQDNQPLDADGHGTHVAGVISALGNNAVGTVGVCWNASIMPLKVQPDGEEAMESVAVIRAIDYAMDHGARIVNCSFGSGAFSLMESIAYGKLMNAGGLAVCAAGNSSENTDVPADRNYPSCYDLNNIVSVAASRENDDLASFSNFGPVSVDIAAPGVTVQSTLPSSAGRESRVILHDATGNVIISALAMLYAGITDEAGITETAFDCGLGYPQDFPEEVRGRIALIRRGEIYFSEKTANAMNAGAIAAIIDNNVVDNLDQDGGTLGAPGEWIPVVSISKVDGEAIRAMETPLVTVVNIPVSTGGAYGVKSGTSFAAPHVSGTAGLILSKSPDLDYTRLKNALLDTADKIPALDKKVASGGRLNALAALCSANTLSADLSFDQTLGLEDAVIAVQIGSGGDSSPICPLSTAPALDINKNHIVGVEEAVYILRRLAGME
jgi:subtilisin family serine protease